MMKNKSTVDFVYGTKVRITKGFYAGQLGYIVDYHIVNTKIEYRVAIDTPYESPMYFKICCKAEELEIPAPVTFVVKVANLSLLDKVKLWRLQSDYNKQ